MQFYRNSNLKKTARLILGLCSLFFCSFSFLYLYCLQSDALTLAQHILSKGHTSYSKIWGAVIVTLVLQLLVILYKRTHWYSLKAQALYFFPSCLILGAMTCFVPTHDGNVMWNINWLACSLYVIIYGIIIWISLHFPDTRNDKSSIHPYLWINFVLLAIQLCMAAHIGNTNDAYHYRLKVQELVLDNNDTAALEVGKKSLAHDRELTALRTLALSRIGNLGNALFHYPQEYGSEGLLPNTQDTMLHTQAYRDVIYKYLGGYPGRNISSTKQFLKLLINAKTVKKPAYDYLLCAYLLDKDLETFVKLLPRYYPSNEGLPKHYKEAMIMYLHHEGKTDHVLYDKQTADAYLKYLEIKSSFKNPVEQNNQCRREFGQTYWWYYDFK